MRRHGRRHIQTVKSQGVPGAGLSRGEWEDPVRGDRPDPQAPQSGRLLPPDIIERLEPLFRTEVNRRTTDLFPAAGTHVEVAIDTGRVYVPARDIGEPICEVELELKHGGTKLLYDLALDLLAVAPLRIEARSKAERGYWLAAAKQEPDAAHAADLVLEPRLDGDEVLRRIGLSCLDQILRNDAAVLAGVPEGVHQMRVAVRRLRAILSSFKAMLPDEQQRWASEELRWLGDALGMARNLDVFTSEMLAPAHQALGDSEGIAALAAAAEQRRQGAYARASKALRSVRYTAMLLRLLRWFDGRDWRAAGAAPELRQPISALAAGLLEQRRHSARRRAKGFARQSPEQRHRLRIALKKLRYATELLATLYDTEEVRQFTRQLKRMQDDLGDANDVQVARELIAELTEHPAAGDAAIAGDAIIEWHQQRIAENEPKMRRHLDRLLAAPPFWQQTATAA